MCRDGSTEGLKIFRFLMVLASFSPLFMIWVVQGSTLVPNAIWIPACLVLIIFPNLALIARLLVVKRHRDMRSVAIGHADDHRDHLLVYLFAMLLPLYNANLDSRRSLAAVVFALGFIVFLFWHSGLHYMNIFFAVAGYRVFTVHPPEDRNRFSDDQDFVLISRRSTIAGGQSVQAYRISDTVYWEDER